MVQSASELKEDKNSRGSKIYLYDRSAKKLRPLDIGTKVWVQHPETKKWDSTTTILSRIRKRTYQIQMEDGKITHRNRRWI